MVTYALEEFPPDVQRIIKSLSTGESAVITENNRPVAQLSSVAPADGGKPQPRKFGFAKGLVTRMTEDFNAPVKDFGDL